MSDDDSYDDVEYEDGKRHNVTNLYSNRYDEERMFDDSYDSEEDDDYEDVDSDSEDPYEYDEDYESSSSEEEEDDDLT